MHDTNLITREELQKRLKVDTRKIIDLEKKGMPVIDLGYKTKRYNIDEVMAWINNNQ